MVMLYREYGVLCAWPQRELMLRVNGWYLLFWRNSGGMKHVRQWSYVHWPQGCNSARSFGALNCQAPPMTDDILGRDHGDVTSGRAVTMTTTLFSLCIYQLTVFEWQAEVVVGVGEGVGAWGVQRFPHSPQWLAGACHPCGADDNWPTPATEHSGKNEEMRDWPENPEAGSEEDVYHKWVGLGLKRAEAETGKEIAVKQVHDR